MQSELLNIGIVGFGYWGPNLARNVSYYSHFSLLAIADLSEEKRLKAHKAFPNTKIVETYQQLISISEIDIVIIATASKSHYEIAKAALENGKHVLLEKPACASYQKLFDLSQLAKHNRLILMVDFTFLYNGAVRKIQDIVKKPEFGDINYIDSTRINLGIFQSDVNVIWDLASHDIAIFQYLLNQSPISVKADGISHTDNGIENIAYITLKYINPMLLVHVSCSWYSPVKIRQMLIGGSNKMLIYNDIEPTDKIKIYDCNFSFKQNESRESLLIDYRLGDITIPKFNTREPLSFLMEDLHLSVIGHKKQDVSIELALGVAKVLEAAQVSIKSKGKEIYI